MPIASSSLPVALLLAASLWLAACRDGDAAGNTVRVADITAVDNRAGTPPQPVADIVNAAIPRAFDPTSQAAKGKAGARAILDGWASALERRDWATARGAWGHDGADSGLDPAAFARAYDRYRDIRISIGEGEGDAAAGSLYYQAPVTLTAQLRDGRQVRMAGPVTLRRVNDVDGASAADLRWHISRSDLKPRP